MRGSWIIVALVLGGCSTPAFVKTAYYGDLASLKQQIADAERTGRVGKSDVVGLARAVARREVRSGAGKDAIARIRAASACASSVEPELTEWSRGEGEIAGEALLVLSEAGLADAADFVDSYAKADNGALRAVAARGTFSRQHAELRRSYFKDPDARVRAAAFRSAAIARDATDLPQLLESVRLDPDDDARALAVRATGMIGGPEAVLGLEDLWATASAGTQDAIVRAWAAPRSFEAGGDRELLRAAERADSYSSVVAAGELLRIEATGRTEAIGVLERAILRGTDEERMLAIQLAPLSDPVSAEAIDKATKDGVPVAAVAFARLLEVPNRRAAALAALRGLSTHEDSAARQSRSALAAAGDDSVAPALKKQLGDPVGWQRTRAALGLYRLGRGPSMATALADPDPAVRMAVACGILALENHDAT